MKRQIAKKTIGIIGLVVLLGAFAVFARATTVSIEYPSFVSSTGPADFVNQLYNWSLGIAGTLAVVMIVYGGIKYAVSAGNVAQQRDAKSIITSAIWGMVLLAGAYLILYTINPGLVSLKSPSLAPIPAATSTPPTTANPSTQLTSQEGYTIAGSFGIRIYSSGGCMDQTNPKCTSFEGFPKYAMCELIYMAQNMDLRYGSRDITVVGGTEVGHKEHGPGKPVVDLRFSGFASATDRYILSQIGKTKDQVLAHLDDFSNRFSGTDGNTYVLESNPNHWHVQLQLHNVVDLTSAGSKDMAWYQCTK